MDKIASPQELQDELNHLQALVARKAMPRRMVASLIRNLAYRVAGEVVAFDSTALRDLSLYMENERSLHNQKQSIIKNIQQKMKSGRYDSNLAPKLWMYRVDSGAKAYIKEFASPGTRMQDLYPKPLRAALAKQFAEEYEEAIKDGDYGEI